MLSWTVMFYLGSSVVVWDDDWVLEKCLLIV